MTNEELLNLLRDIASDTNLPEWQRDYATRFLAAPIEEQTARRDASLRLLEVYGLFRN